MPAPSASPHQTSYDLYLGSGQLRFVLRNPNHGVTLTGHDIAWVADDERCRLAFRDIAEVHLQTGNVGRSTIATCRLTCADGSTVVIMSSNSSGLQDDALDKLYVQFVYDLHARLAALKGAHIAFTAGFSEARYRFGKVICVVAGLFFIVMPTVLLLMTGAWSMVWALYLGVLLVWPLYRLMQANAPRAYEPGAIPPEVLPAG